MKLKSSQPVQGWYMNDDYVAFLEQSYSAVIVGPKGSKTKFVYLLRSSTISVM